MVVVVHPEKVAMTCRITSMTYIYHSNAFVIVRFVMAAAASRFIIRNGKIQWQPLCQVVENSWPNSILQMM